MKLLLDQGTPRSTAALLRNSGFDAVHTVEIGLAEAEDDQILAKASEEGRIVVTLDADFHTHLALAKAKGPSVSTRQRIPHAVKQWTSIRPLLRTVAKRLQPLHRQMSFSRPASGALQLICPFRRVLRQGLHQAFLRGLPRCRGAGAKKLPDNVISFLAREIRRPAQSAVCFGCLTPTAPFHGGGFPLPCAFAAVNWLPANP